MEIIVVADKQASKFLRNRKNLSTVNGSPVAIGDIVEGIIDKGPFVLDGERWVVASPDILIHDQQITNKAEAEALLSCLKDGVGGSVGFRGSGSYDTIIIGCDPDLAEGYLVTALEEYFGYEDIAMTSPSLGVEGTPDPRLLDKVNKLLYPSTTEKDDVADRAKVANVRNVGKIIVVADKQASGFLNNPWNFGASGVPDIVTRNIVDHIKVAGLKGEGRLFWNGKRWVDVYPRVAVHDQQVTKISEVPDIISGLLTSGYETVIIGCDPSIATTYLTYKLREVFGSENVTEIYPHLGKGFEQYKDLGDRIKELLGLSKAGAGAVSTEGTEGSEKERTPQKQTLHLKVTLTDTENVIDILLDKGTHLKLDFRDTTKDTV